MAVDPSTTKPIVAPTPPAETGKPDMQIDAGKVDNPVDDIDGGYWLDCLNDAERAEGDWRKRGREIVQIYRNETGSKGTPTGSSARASKSNGAIIFNILFANTETMLPAIYTKPPEPVVRSRFNDPETMQPPMPPPPPFAPGSLGAAPVPPMPMPPSGPPSPSAPPAPGSPVAPTPTGSPGIEGGGPPSPSLPPPLPAPPPMAAPPPKPPPLAAANKPSQETIETAAAVIEKALEIVVEDEMSHESVKAAIKDVLLPGRGVVRVRWVPTIESQPVRTDDVTGQPVMEEVKVWEQVNDEYVYWEDILLDPVRAPGDTDWIAFRHLFTAKQAISEFQGSSPKFDALVAAKKLESELCLYTEETAAKTIVGSGAPMKSASKLGNVIKKMMVWEIWDRPNRRIIWFVRELGGTVLRIDNDTYQLEGFYPIPKPLLAITTTDTQIPRAFYDLYADLAADLDETSRRISNLTKKIKVRGGYNSASSDIANILTADDGKMLPVDGVDMINGGLQNHIWLVPILEWVNALKELYIAREQIKQAIYEIMGISDIMRGATKASETATAQRIKGSMGMVRLSDQKGQAANFVTDLLRMKAELIAKNFDASTLAQMTGEDITPEVMDLLRSDFMRTCTVDIESDSTVVPDMQEEQQTMQMSMVAIQGVLQSITQMAASPIFPPVMVTKFGIQLLIMMMHPMRHSRGVVKLLQQFDDMLQMQMGMMPPVQPPVSQPSPSPGGGPPGKASPGPTPPKTNGSGPPVSNLPQGPGAITF